MRYQPTADAHGGTGIGGGDRKGQRQHRRSHPRISKPAPCADGLPDRTPTRPLDPSAGLVIPGLHSGIPLIIQRDHTAIVTMRRLVDMGMLAMTDSATCVEELVSDGFTRMLGPALHKFDDDHSNVRISGDEDSDLLTASAWDCCLEEAIELEPVIALLKQVCGQGTAEHLAEVADFKLKPELPVLASPDLLRWFGWLVNNHSGLAHPAQWPDRLKELYGEERDDDGDSLPTADPDEISQEVKSLTDNYPYLLNPEDAPCITNELASEMIGRVDKELASILTDLADGCWCEGLPGYQQLVPGVELGEPYACTVLRSGDRVSDALERTFHAIQNGYYDISENWLFTFTDTIEELPGRFAAYDKWLQPVTRLQAWVNKQTTREH